MIRVALIGYGYWGPNLFRNFLEIKNVDITAVCDRNPENLKKVPKRHNTIKLTTNPEDIFKNKAIDVVSIATPLSTHYHLAMRALESGKHVLVEKPMCLSIRESHALISMAKKKRLVLAVDHTFIYTPAVIKIKELIKKNILGEIYYFDSIRVNLGLFQHDTNVLWDLASHDISILNYLIDKKPVSVNAVGSCHTGSGIEDIAYLTLTYKDNFIAHIHSSWLSPVKARKILICGSKNMIIYDDNDSLEKIRVYNKGIIIKNNLEDVRRLQILYRMGDMYAPCLETKEALKVECEHFIECITNGKKPVSDGYAGLEVVRVLEAASLSIKMEGEKVKL